MQVRMVETAEGPIRVERKNVRKGQGKTLGVFSNHDGRGSERAARYIAAKRHSLVERLDWRGRKVAAVMLAEIEDLLKPVGTFARGA